MDKRAAVPRYMRTQIIWSFAINVILNALLAYFMNTKKPYGQMTRTDTCVELAIDLALTGIILGSLNFWFGVDGVRKAGLRGALGTSPRCLAIANHPFLSGMLLGLLIALALFVLTSAVFALTRAEHFALMPYVVYKSAAAGLMGAAVTGISVRAAFRAPAGTPEVKV